MQRVANSCAWPLFWQSEALLEILWEPRAFSEGQRPSELRNRRAREALLGAGRDRSGRAAGGRIRARLRREAHAQGRAPAAAALCEAIARRLDAESQAAGPRALLECRHVCGPPRRAGHCAARVRLRARSLR